MRMYGGSYGRRDESYSVRRSKLLLLPPGKGFHVGRWVIGVTLDVTCSADTADPVSLRSRVLTSFSPLLFISPRVRRNVRCKTNVSILTGMMRMTPVTTAYESSYDFSVRQSRRKKRGTRSFLNQFFRIWEIYSTVFWLIPRLIIDDA